MSARGILRFTRGRACPVCQGSDGDPEARAAAATATFPATDGRSSVREASMPGVPLTTPVPTATSMPRAARARAGESTPRRTRPRPVAAVGGGPLSAFTSTATPTARSFTRP
jgi:hypothetical protein